MILFRSELDSRNQDMVDTSVLGRIQSLFHQPARLQFCMTENKKHYLLMMTTHFHMTPYLPLKLSLNFNYTPVKFRDCIARRWHYRTDQKVSTERQMDIYTPGKILKITSVLVPAMNLSPRLHFAIMTHKNTYTHTYTHTDSQSETLPADVVTAGNNNNNNMILFSISASLLCFSRPELADPVQISAKWLEPR